MVEKKGEEEEREERKETKKSKTSFFHSHRDLDVRQLVDGLGGVERVLDELAHRRVEGLARLKGDKNEVVEVEKRGGG